MDFDVTSQMEDFDSIPINLVHFIGMWTIIAEFPVHINNFCFHLWSSIKILFELVKWLTTATSAIYLGEAIYWKT